MINTPNIIFFLVFVGSLILVNIIGVSLLIIYLLVLFILLITLPSEKDKMEKTLKDLTLTELLLLAADREKKLSNSSISGEEYWFITKEIADRLSEINLRKK